MTDIDEHDELKAKHRRQGERLVAMVEDRDRLQAENAKLRAQLELVDVSHLLDLNKRLSEGIKTVGREIGDYERRAVLAEEELRRYKQVIEWLQDDVRIGPIAPLHEED